MRDTWVLDSYAVLALLQEQEGSEVALGLLKQAQDKTARVVMSWVNVGEVLYIVERRWGKEKSLQVLGLLEATGIEIVEVGRGLALNAAGIKAGHPLAYADAFAAALAMAEDATLVTGDPELHQVEKTVSIQWLPHSTTRR